MHGLSADTDWGLASLLYELERYNGLGYRLHHPEVRSPYLWSFSTHYSSGKYVTDGRWSHSARSAQCGAATLLRRLVELGHAVIADQPPLTANHAPRVVRYAKRKPTAAATLVQARALQRWLNGSSGIFLKIDGWPEQRTSSAWQQVTGHYLPGDPRAMATRGRDRRAPQMQLRHSGTAAQRHSGTAARRQDGKT